MKIKVIGWDLEGVLYPYTDEILGRVREVIYKKISTTKGWSIEKSKEVFQEYYAKHHGATAALISLGFKKETMQECLEKADILDLLQYDERLVAMFKNLNVFRHVLVTESSRELAVKKLRKIGLEVNNFKHLITADDIKNPKPHPEAFERLISCAQVAPGEILYVEDRTEYALVAKGLGIQAILVGKAKSDLVCVPNVYEVESILNKLK